MLSRIRQKFSGLLEILSKPFINLNPNHITLLGLFFSFLTFLSLYYKNIILSIIFLSISSLMDAVDGFVARLKKKTSKFGSFLDSNVDRLSDALILLGIGFYINNLLLSYIALIFFFMVSYSRAKAEIFLKRFDIGIAERAERLLIILFGLILEIFIPVLKYILIILIILSVITYIHRVIYAYISLK